MKIALARELLKLPNMIVFDQCCAKLNYEERNSFEDVINSLNIPQLSKVIIPFKNISVENFDHIIVIDQGKVVEEGTHDDLINVQGAYSEIISNNQDSIETLLKIPSLKEGINDLNQRGAHNDCQSYTPSVLSIHANSTQHNQSFDEEEEENEENLLNKPKDKTLNHEEGGREINRNFYYDFVHFIWTKSNWVTKLYMLLSVILMIAYSLAIF